MITKPSPPEILASPLVVVEEWAWSDDGIASVEITVDDGLSWIKADVSVRIQYEWQSFRATLNLQVGEQLLIARAISILGHRQPLSAWRNHAHSVRFTVQPSSWLLA